MDGGSQDFESRLPGFSPGELPAACHGFIIVLIDRGGYLALELLGCFGQPYERSHLDDLGQRHGNNGPSRGEYFIHLDRVRRFG